jgi:hypothetical protein
MFEEFSVSNCVGGFFLSSNILCRGLRRPYDVFRRNQIFCLKKSRSESGLDPDSATAWIRIKQYPGFGAGFSKMSGSSLSDYGFETIPVPVHICVLQTTLAQWTSADSLRARPVSCSGILTR